MLHKTSYPEHFSPSEVSLLKYQISSAETQVRPYDGNWEAEWLLNSFTEPKWLVRTPYTRLENGEYKGVATIDWQIALPGGSSLVDDANSRMLLAASRSGFLIRKLPEFGVTNTKSLLPVVSDILTITRWTYLFSELYQPAEAGFSLLDERALRQFMGSYIENGAAWALRYPHRLVNYLYANALGRQPSESVYANLFRLPPKDVSVICKWLDKNDFYIKATNAKRVNFRHLSRKKIAQIIGRDSRGFTTDKMVAFLRQFEPEILAHSKEILLPSEGRKTECISQNARLISEIAESPLTFTSVASMHQAWECLFKLHRHDPGLFPNPAGIKFAHIRHFHNAKAKPNDHTPWVPLSTSLTYTQESLRWISVWGKPLVDFYLKAIKHFRNADLYLKPNDNGDVKKQKSSMRTNWICSNIPDELKALNIQGWTSVFSQGQADVFNQLRNAPSLNDAIQILIGAILTLVSTVKPMRTGELFHLKKSCLYRADRDGYYINQVQSKRGTENVLKFSNRPIPAIAAYAIQLLITLGDELKTLAEEENEFAKNSLFYLASTDCSATFSTKVCDEHYLILSMDRFCDFVAIPPDKNGRRWYIRIHENRKSFLITFFWCFKYSSLGAASWMAGHASWEMTLRYIEANFPGDELPEFEASYAAEQLWSFEKNEPTETTNVHDLYRSVCNHFGVQEISLIQESQLREWLAYAFRRRIYSIEPVQLQNKCTKKSVEIAFRIRRESEDA